MSFDPVKEARMKEIEAMFPDVAKEIEKPAGFDPVKAARMKEIEAELGGDIEAELGDYAKSLQPADTILDALGPGIEDLKGRAFVKNFGANTQSEKNYLQEINPQADFTVSGENEIAFRPKNPENPNAPYYQIDPSLSMEAFSTKPKQAVYELGRDVRDILSDAVTGIGSGAAGVGGFVLGGGLPGAAVASGAASYGLEAIRQAIGSAGGIKDNVNPTQMATNALMDTGGTLLLGPGVGKETIKKMATSTLSEKALTNQSKGMIGRSWDALASKYGTKIASSFSGIPKEIVDKFVEKIDLVRAAELDPKIVEQQLANTKKVALDAMQENLRLSGEDLNVVREEIAKSGTFVNMQNVIEPLNSLIKDKEKIFKNKEFTGPEVQQINDIISGIFMETAKVPKKPTPSSPKSFLETLNGIVSDLFTKTSQVVVKPGFPATKYTNAIPPETQTIKVLMSSIPAEQIPGLKKRIEALAETLGVNMDNLDTGKAVNNAKPGANQDLARALQQVAGNLESQLEKSLPEKLRTKYVNSKKDYGLAASSIEEIAPAFANADSFFNFIKKQTPGTRGLRRGLSEISDIDLDDFASDIMALHYYSKPSYAPMSMGSSTTGRILQSSGAGAAAGGLVGSAFGMPVEGAALGSGVAPGLLSTTAGHRAAYSMNEAVRNFARNKYYNAFQAPYLMMSLARPKMDKEEKGK